MSSPAYIGRADFLAPTPRRYAEFLWPGRGVVRFRSFSELEKSKLENQLNNLDGTRNADRELDLRVRYIAASAVDENDTLLFTAADIPSLLKLDASVVAGMFSVVLSLQAMDDVSTLEALVGNSGGTQSDDSQSS